MGQTGQTFIIDRAGNLIASSTIAAPYIADLKNKKLQQIPAVKSENSVIRATAQAILDRFGDFNKIQQGQHLNLKFANQRQLVQVAPVADERGIDWLSIVVVPESDFMAQINANSRSTILLCLGALAVTTVLGLLTSRWIAKPIMQLQEASQAISSGHLDKTIQVQGIDELESLANSFNQMANQLQLSFLELENRSRTLQNALEQLNQSQLQLVQSEKMSALGTLLSGIAHEINNPLGFIAGNIQLAQENLADLLEHLELYEENTSATEIEDHAEDIDLEYLREDFPKILKSMNVEVEQMKNISTSLRIFSRKDQEHKTKFNIHDGIESTLLILKHRTKASDQRPQIEILKEYEELPEINCFPGQLNQVFMNILANAIDAFDEANLGKTYAQIQQKPNQIKIRTSQLDALQVQIEIQDNGSGMKPQTKARIFEQGFTTKGVGKGTGLGMAIAHQIITEKHGGEITCNSTVGEGTIFTIILPIV